MPTPAIALLLPLLLHSEGSLLTRPVSAPGGPTGTSRITVTAETPARQHEVWIAPGRGLLLVFDTPVRRDALQLQERERFRSVSLSEDGLVLTLLPPEGWPLGKQLELGVRFLDGELPVSLDLLLVVHPEAAFQVEVYRRSRSGESYRREAQEARTQLMRCQTALTQSCAMRQEPSGLVSLLVMGRMREEGVRGRRVERNAAFRREDALRLKKAVSYIARGEEQAFRTRLAVDLTVENTGLEPWRPTQARFVTGKGEWPMDVWAPKPLAPGEVGRVLAEVELPDAEVPTGPSLLRLRNEEGSRQAVLSGMTFPSFAVAVAE